MKLAANQTCTLWKKTGVDGEGKATFAAPEEFLARWEERAAKFQEHNGDERISNSVIYIEDYDLISPGDFVAEGSIADLTPISLKGVNVRSVRARNRVKSVNAKDQLVKLYCQ